MREIMNVKELRW